MVRSTSPIPDSCRPLEVFNLKNVTSVAGASLFIDFMRYHMQIHKHINAFPLGKAPWSTYTLINEIEALLCAYAVGCDRISHIEDLELDPLLCWKPESSPVSSTSHKENYLNLNAVSKNGAVRAL